MNEQRNENQALIVEVKFKSSMFPHRRSGQIGPRLASGRSRADYCTGQQLTREIHHFLDRNERSHWVYMNLKCRVGNLKHLTSRHAWRPQASNPEISICCRTINTEQLPDLQLSLSLNTRPPSELARAFAASQEPHNLVS